MSIGIGVIGTGLMGADHALRFERDVKGAHLAAVSDIDRIGATRCLEAVDAPEARYIPDAVEMINDPAIDAVVITTPDRFHVPLTLAALEAGKPVLCEKPLAPSAAECAEVLEAETALVESGGSARVTLGFMRRFDPGCLQLRRSVEAEEFGSPLMLHCVHRNVDAYPGGSEHTINASAVHEFDFIPWLLGSPIASVSWHAGASSSRTHRQDPQLLLLRTESDVLVTLELLMSAKYGYEVRAELVCESGTRELCTSEPTTVRHERGLGFELPPDSTLKYEEAYRREATAWIRSIQQRADPAAFGLATAWDGYLAAAVSDAALESMRGGDGRSIEVRAPEQAQFYRSRTAR